MRVSQAVLQKQASRGQGAHLHDVCFFKSAWQRCQLHVCHSYAFPKNSSCHVWLAEACHTRPPDDSSGCGPWMAQHRSVRVSRNGSRIWARLIVCVCLYVEVPIETNAQASSRLGNHVQTIYTHNLSACMHAQTYMHAYIHDIKA